MNIESVAICWKVQGKSGINSKAYTFCTVYSLYNEYSSMRGLKVSLMIYRAIIGNKWMLWHSCTERAFVQKVPLRFRIICILVRNWWFHVLYKSAEVYIIYVMRSSLVVRASDCQCTSCNGPGFDPSIRRHSGIWGAADEQCWLNIVRTKKIKNPPKKYLKKKKYMLCKNACRTKNFAVSPSRNKNKNN